MIIRNLKKIASIKADNNLHPAMSGISSLPRALKLLMKLPIMRGNAPSKFVIFSIKLNAVYFNRWLEMGL